MLAVRRTSQGKGRRPKSQAWAVNELLMKLPPCGVVAWTMIDATFLIIIIRSTISVNRCSHSVTFSKITSVRHTVLGLSSEL